MSYSTIKWLILIIPTLTIGLWEFLRHSILLPYLTMETGNWLAAALIFIVTMTVTRRLFAMLEETQRKLNQEQAANATLEAREQVARELHDGISQSLFLLAVKMEQLELETEAKQQQAHTAAIKRTLKQVYEDVRAAIASLRYPVNQQADAANHMLARTEEQGWQQLLRAYIYAFEQQSGMAVTLEWQLADHLLTAREQADLFAALREALVNIQKHSDATVLSIAASGSRLEWSCRISDNGSAELPERPFDLPGRYGLRMMADRCAELGWALTLRRTEARTVLTIHKGGHT